jgi:hypothetical protein
LKLKLILFVLLCVSVIFSQPETDFLLSPCSGNEILNSKTKEIDLTKILSKKNSKRVERFYAEGTERVIGTVFFSDTPKEFFIKWKDTLSFSNPEWIEIHGDSSLWSINNGIKIGTELKNLVKLNGKQFSFHGFDWDYGGYANFKNGRLDSDCYSVRLYYDYIDLFEYEWNQILGDRIISTNDPVLKKIKIYVDEIRLYFK